MWKLWKELERFEISEQQMADQVRTIINKKWFTAELLNEIRRSEEHHIRMKIFKQH